MEEYNHVLSYDANDMDYGYHSSIVICSLCINRCRELDYRSYNYIQRKTVKIKTMSIDLHRFLLLPLDTCI